MFGDIFWASGCQGQANLAAEEVFVCDGAGWIWVLIELYNPQATQIVDWVPYRRTARKSGPRSPLWGERSGMA